MEDLQSPLLAGGRRSTVNTWLLFLGLLFVAFLLFLIIFIIARVPLKTPIAHVNSVSTSSFNLIANSTQLKGHWDAVLSLRNPHMDADIKYEARAWLYYKNQFVSSTGMNGFHQRSQGQEILVPASFIIGGKGLEIILDDDYGFKEDINNGAAMFDLLVEANVTVNPQSWPKRKAFLMVDCNDLKIDFPSNQSLGRLAGGAKSCQAQMWATKLDALV